jgi:F-type H+-transporting ATPase subunit a
MAEIDGLRVVTDRSFRKATGSRRQMRLVCGTALFFLLALFGVTTGNDFSVGTFPHIGTALGAQEEAATGAEPAAEGAEEASEKFNAGEVIIEHVANSSLEHPLIHLPTIAGIDMSVTKHVFMLWLVSGILLLVITTTVRGYLKHDRLVPSGFMNALESVVEFIRDSVAEPNIGHKWTKVWTPILLTLFVFILGSNAIGMIPIFEVLALLNHWVLHASADSFFGMVLHGGSTTTSNFNVTAGLAVVSFFAIIIAGSKAHGAVQHWKNLVPHGVSPFLAAALIPIEILGMFVRPFALTMRLAANMTGGHIAILAILSFVFIFTEMAGQAVGMGVGLAVSIPLAVGISALELIVILVQAYVFTLLTAVFIGMAIHAHH